MTLKLLSVASECAPFVKTGGLADVVGALGRVVGAHDVECRVLLPLYRQIAHLASGAKEALNVGSHFGGPVRVLEKRESGIDLLLIDAPHLYDRPGQIYLNESGVDWADNHLRFGLLGWLGAEIGRTGIAGWMPDVIHAHDWQAGLAPVYLRQAAGAAPPCVLTIHNIAFQGNFPATTMGTLGLDPKGFTQDGFEYFGQISFLKGGLTQADQITTVSPTYARELMTPEFGMGLEGVLMARKADLSGILNGIDMVAWDPATDPALAQNYTSRTLAKRAVNKQAVLDHFGLGPDTSAPLFSVISRLSEQKGLDLALQALPAILEKGARFVLLGSGTPELEHGFRQLAARFPSSVGVEIGFNEDLAHLMQAGADATLVPSRFEPCGLTQLCAMRYGTVPIVSVTGGLADTVIDANEAALAAGCATGLQFAPTTAEKLGAALDRAMAIYADRTAWQKIQRNGMKHPVGWDVSAQRMADIYNNLAGA
ncbi:starch synthase [Aliiroseovarius sediminilitoris]|uniref:Glycogen synthase n=1 Tax=Aliiroseovarius sediminilitoris TaxID=1173584 RepID=A0A1I0R758_9RHOB|nr:glycogen synthase GlgA [Aliiroseovarius sediminilitoris]SEW36495.1 starch synthase [Aliiroseovarius sediminilitoris]